MTNNATAERYIVHCYDIDGNRTSSLRRDTAKDAKSTARMACECGDDFAAVVDTRTQAVIYTWHAGPRV